MPLFDRKFRMRLGGCLQYPMILSRFASRLAISHQPKLLVKNRPNPTENRPTLTENRPDATFSCHFATLLRHFAHDTNSHLRQIVSDFLTSGNRVGATPESIESNDFAFAKRLLANDHTALGVRNKPNSPDSRCRHSIDRNRFTAGAGRKCGHDVVGAVS